MTDQTNIGQNISSSVPFSPQADLPPLPPEFQNLTAPTVQESNSKTDSGSATPPVPEFSNITANPKKKFGTGKIIATILGIMALVGSIGAGTYLVGQKQIFQQKAQTISCSENYCPRCGCGCYSTTGDCAASTNCNANCPTATPNPVTGETCAYSCLTMVDGKCPAGSYSQQGNCNAAGTACCKIASGGATATPSTTEGCIFDNYQTKVCTTINGVQQLCGTNPKGEVGISVGSCSNTNTSNTGIDQGCPEFYPDCVPGNHCVNLAKTCTPSVPIYGNCKTDSSCTGSTTPPSSCVCNPTCQTGPVKESQMGCGADSGITCTGGQVCVLPICCYKPPPTTPPTPTPTSSPVAPYCAAIHVYDTDWNLISQSADTTNLSTLKPGDTIRFTVEGSPASGIDMAKFTVNARVGEVNQGALSGEITTKKPGTNEFYFEYTIPAGATSISVSGQVHHSTGWF